MPIPPLEPHHREGASASEEALARVPTTELLLRLGLAPERFEESVLREIGARYLRVAPKRGEPMNSPVAVAARLQARWGDKPVEHFIALALDTRLQLIREILVAKGGLSTVHVRPREIFRPVIAANAASLIVAHNHPSGDPEPSQEDLALTQRLVQAGEMLAIPVLDHLVVAAHGYVSLRERGAVPGAFDVGSR